MELQTILSFLTEVLNWLFANWELIVSFPIVSAILLIPKKYIKKYFKHAEIVMIVLVGFSGQIMSAINYLTSVPTDNPTIVALQGFGYSFGLIFSWFVATKPVKNFVARKIPEAQAHNEARSAIVPDGGLPLNTPQDDFIG